MSWKLKEKHVFKSGFPPTFSFPLKLNVRATFIGNCVVGLFVVPDHQNGVSYCVYLQEVLPMLFDDVPLAARRHMYIQHGASAQFSDEWLGPLSPDLNPLNYSVWGKREWNFLQVSSD